MCHPTWIKLFQNVRYRLAKRARHAEMLLFVLIYILVTINEDINYLFAMIFFSN